MKHLAVSASGLGKSYFIPRANAPTWREWVRRPRDVARRRRRVEVRALNDVSFDVEDGEVFGIVGRNGAGKSTLLKILSRITSPSRGMVRLTGHVASLLEVGTGFHPDLTGRENVYLNGMLLGMTARDVSKAFDAIVEFAGTEAYIDVPIKRYSSGMQLRLAFAVAAHLAADTMVIDEVLAVGDAEFQRKCLGAMRDISRRGRTTLFVSHNMSAVQTLCTRVMWLDRGAVRALGEPDRVIREYLAAGHQNGNTLTDRLDLSTAARGSWLLETARIDSITFERLTTPSDLPPWHVLFGEPFALDIALTVERPSEDLVIGIGVRNDRGEDVLTTHTVDCGTKVPKRSGQVSAAVHIGDPWLRAGTYYVELAVISGAQLLDHVVDAAVLTVDEQSAKNAPPAWLKKGVIVPRWTWTVR